MINNSRKYFKRKSFFVIILFALALWILGSTQNINYQVFHNSSPNISLIRFSSYSLDFIAVLSCIILVLLLILLFFVSFNIQNYKTSFITLVRKTRKSTTTTIHNRYFLFIVVSFIIVFAISYLINLNFPTSPVISPTNPISSTPTTSTPPLSTSRGSSTTTNPSAISYIATSCVAPCNTISPPQVLFNLVNSYLIFILIGVFLLLIAILRFYTHTPNKVTSEPSAKISKLENQDKTRETIIAQYLKASAYLEQLGADQRFSLTPQEFEANIKQHMKEIWSKFPKIT